MKPGAWRSSLRTMAAQLRDLALGAVVFVAIFLVLGEVFLRTVFWGGESFSARTGPIVRRFERGFRLNSFDGPSRGPEPSGPKTPGGTRIVVQGDSITWGQGVKDEDQLFSTRLLRALRESNPAVDMAVLARPGREIDEHVQQLKKWGTALTPDAIIYQWYINDMQLGTSRKPKTERLWRRPSRVYSTLHGISFFVFFLDFCLDTLLPSGGESYESYLADHFGEGDEAWHVFEERFAEWALSAKELTPRVMVALYPHLRLRSGDPPAMLPEIVDIHARVLALCRRNNLSCVDLLPALATFPDSRLIQASRFDGHPSAEAHRVIAEVLFEAIREARWNERN